MTNVWILVGVALVAIALLFGAFTAGHRAGFMRGWQDRSLDCVNGGGEIDEEQDGHRWVPWWRSRRVNEPTPAQLPSVLEHYDEYDGEAELIEAPAAKSLPAHRPCDVN